MIKRGISVLLALVFIISAAPHTVFGVSQADDFPDYAPDGTYTEGLGITDEQYRVLRTRICTAARSCDTECDISDFGFVYGYATSSLIARIAHDYDPLSFHVSGVAYKVNNSMVIQSVKLFYNCTAEEYAAKSAEFSAASDEILSGIEGNDELSDLQKALLLHDRIAVRCEYDVETLNSGEYLHDDYNAYGALVKRVTMCEGYSKAYSSLLNRVGIRSYLVDSEALGHMWNVVYIGGEKYHVDVTWDDATPNKQGQVKHRYFLRSTEKFKKLEHNATDYDETPVSDSYDVDGNFVWQSSETEVVLCGGEMYAMAGPFLYKFTGDTACTEIRRFSATWYASNGYYYTGAYQSLATDGNYLFISQPESIIRYNPASGEIMTVYEYDKGGYWYIYGMTYRDGLFYIDPYNSPNFEEDTEKLYGFTVPYVAPVPHDHVAGDPVSENVEEPTCERAGHYYEVVYCTVCGEEISRTDRSISALGHDYVEFRIEPTCTENGLYKVTCSRCEKVKEERVIAAHHKFGNTYIYHAKCTEDGGKKRVCSVCGYIEWTDVEPALGHDFSDEFTVDREPTYIEYGEMSRHCKRCSERTDITVIPKLDGMPGDIDGNGDLTMKDVLIMRRYIAGLEELDDSAVMLGDLDGDGDLTMKDVLKARRIIAGLD